MFRNLGCKVNLVNTRDKLLEFLDDEIIDALSYHLRDRGVLIRHSEEYERVEGRDDGVVLHLKSGKKLKTDVLLWANGRTGNTDELGLRARRHRARQPRPASPSTTTYQTARAAHLRRRRRDRLSRRWPAPPTCRAGPPRMHIIERPVRDSCWPSDIPTGIYTSPEISSLGKTERELTAAKVPYEVGHAQFKSLARAQITGRTVGMLKLLFHRETLALLGIHCFGANASRDHPHRPGDHDAAGRRPTRCSTSSTRRSTTRRWPRPTAWRRSTGSTG